MTTATKLTTCPRRTAVAYARYSSSQQRDVSIEQQLDDIRAYAEREGYTLIYEYADRAKSGYKNTWQREAFQEMLRAAATGAFDTVIAWKVDRFGRNRRESAIYKGQLADNGVSVVYAMEPIPDGAAGALTEGMLEAIAEWYSRNLSENIRRGQRDNAKKAISNGNRIYGYRRGPDGHYVIHEPEAAMVRRIFTLYSHGNSARNIARILAADGYLTRNGIPYQPQSILYLLTNEAYIGVYHYGDIRVPGGIPAIIDPDLWETCQNFRAKTSFHCERNPVSYILSGRCTCGLCGGPVLGNCGSGRRDRKYYYYSCDNRKRNHTCTLHHFKKEYLEGEVLDFLFNRLLTGPLLEQFVDLVAENLKVNRETTPEKQFEAELSDVNRRILNINRAIAEGVWNQETKTMLDGLSARAETLKKKIACRQFTDRQLITRDRIHFYFQKAAAGRTDDQNQLRALVASLVNSITVYDDYLRIAVNAVEGAKPVPIEDLPPLHALPEIKSVRQWQAGLTYAAIVEDSPVIVFKLAI